VVAIDLTGKIVMSWLSNDVGDIAVANAGVLSAEGEKEKFPSLRKREN
jgi:hypothetical protein